MENAASRELSFCLCWKRLAYPLLHGDSIALYWIGRVECELNRSARRVIGRCNIVIVDLSTMDDLTAGDVVWSYTAHEPCETRPSFASCFLRTSLEKLREAQDSMTKHGEYDGC
jgi:hypothetical protein